MRVNSKDTMLVSKPMQEAFAKALGVAISDKEKHILPEYSVKVSHKTAASVSRLVEK